MESLKYAALYHLHMFMLRNTMPSNKTLSAIDGLYFIELLAQKKGSSITITSYHHTPNHHKLFVTLYHLMIRPYC